MNNEAHYLVFINCRGRQETNTETSNYDGTAEFTSCESGGVLRAHTVKQGYLQAKKELLALTGAIFI